MRQRAGRRITVVLLAALALTVAVPQQSFAKPGGFPLSGLWSLLAMRPSWAGPMPNAPLQAGGSADGRDHNAPASATRAGGGAGRAKGRGEGELAEYTPYARKFTPGVSATGRQGFDPAASERVAAKSTATSTYFHNADGSYTKKFSPTPVNYRDGAGAWQPIDSTLWLTAEGRWRETANSLDVGFAARADDPRLVAVALDAGHTVSYRLDGAASVPGAASGSTMVYPAVLADTDVRLTALASGMREDLLLHSAKAANAWQFPLDLHGLTASVAADGSVALRDAAGALVGSIPVSYAYDAKVDPATGVRAVTHATRYDLSTVDGRQVLTLTLDPTWLHDPARKFPVTVDPSITNTQAITTYVATDGPADHSTEDVIKVGSYDSGPHAARSFLKFPASGIDNSHIVVSAASLDVFVNHANGCPTAQRFDVAAVTQDWTPSTLTTYPGPAVGASIGNLTPATPTACANTAVDPLVGDWVTVPLSVATFNGWADGSIKDFGLGLYAATTDSTHWKYLGSAYTKPPNLTLTYTGNVLPQIIAQHPANGVGVTTLTPQLSAEGTIDPNVEGPSADGDAQYEYQIYDSAGTRVVDSGLVDGAYSVPLGKLQWGKTYLWVVQAFDGANFTPNPVWYQFTVQVPQPAITSTLAQNSGGHGFDPSIGNYTTSATDADISTVGPALSVVRDYNSRDPRATGAFGAAWSSLYDMRAAERYNADGTVSTVVITYPEGSQVGYGRNADGTFTPPSGRAAKLIKLSTGYELIDKADTTYTFAQSLGSGAYGVTVATDANGRAETFTWSSGVITVATSAVSGRALHLNWTTPTGATVAHVSTVVTDPVIAGQATTALTWTYGYTGDRLTSVCPPGSTTACTRYGYATGSPYHSQALDQSPSSFWPLAETTGSTAASAVLASEGLDAATYSNVTLANTAGPLTGGTAMAPSFNGTTSMVRLPDLHIGQALAFSMSVWFKTAVGAGAGVIFSSSDMTIRPTATSGNYSPTLYVGTDGKLLGQFWFTTPGLPTPIKSTASVNDGNWHHVVLTGSQTSQVMYLDGAQAGTMGGWGTLGNVGASMPWLLSHDYLGTGFLGGLPWPDNPYTNDATTLHAVYLNGSIADVSYYDTQITQPDVATLYARATHSTSLLTSITRPGGGAYAAVTYHPVSGTVTNLTDENGGAWVLAAPTVAGSSKVYRASVLGAGPLAYYRLGESAGASQAISDVRYDPGTYTNTTLGVAGRFADQPAASFNGTTSSVRMPSSVISGTGAQSVGVWFNTSTAGQVLASTQASTLGSTTCPCLPILWVTPDGRLRGLAPSTTPTGPLTGGIAGKCVDDWGSGTADGTMVDLYTCNGTDAQNWTINSDGTIRVFGKCLGTVANGTTDATKVQIGSCTGATGQIWQPFGGGLRNPQSGKCLDDPGSTTTDGTQLQIYTCNSSKAQQWTVSLASPQPVNDGKWHQAVLTSSGTAQTLYLDGVKVQSSSGPVTLTAGPQPFTYLGAGYTGTGWSNLTASITSYYTGSMGEAAFYRSELTGAQVTAQYDAAHNSFGLAPVTTVRVTDPGNKTLTYEYDPMHGNRVISSTDGRGSRTSYGYDSSGFLYTTTDANGAVATTGHDAEGNEVSKTTCQNQAANVCSTAYMTYKANTMGVDQAKGGTVTASSSYTASGGWSPANAVDGITTSITSAPGWSSLGSTTAATTQWVQVDLGSARTLNRVDLYPRSDAVGAGFPQAFTVAVSADGTTWNTVTTQTNYAKPTTPAPVPFGFTAQSVRYVKVNATTLRTDGSATFFLQFAEIEAVNDLPDPTAGVLQTQRDPRSASASDNQYLTTYFYDAMGNNYATTGPPVPGFPGGRTSFIYYTDGTNVSAVDTGFVPKGLPYQTASAGGAVHTVAYFHSGDVASTTDADGLVTRYTYDNIGRVASKTVSSGKPAGWWRLNQTAGTSVLDSSGMGNTGSATNVTWANGVGNFDNATGSKIGTVAPVINTAASYTLSAWVNLTTAGTTITPLVSVWGNYYPAAEISYTGRGTWKFQTSDRDVSSPTLTTAESTTAATAGVWTHVAGVYDAASGVMTLYVNGVVSATQTVTNTWSARWLNIGTFVTGAMANVQVYQRALSAGNVSTLFAAGYTGAVTSDTTPSGLVTSYGYDGEGRVTSEVDPPVTDRVTGAVHTPHVTSVFDGDGNLQSQTVADDTGGDAARTKSSTYNQYDQVQSAVDAKLNSTSFTYDAYGNKSSETDPLGNVTTYTYDANGHLLTQALQNYTGDPVSPQTAAPMTEVSRAYDPAGRLASITNALGNTTTYTYTDNGLPVTATRTDNAGANPFVLKTDIYDPAGNITQEVTNNGASTVLHTFDAASRAATTREDPTGVNRTTVLSYTPDDQVATSTRTDGTGATLVTAATYDPMGRVTAKSVGADGTGHPVAWWRLNQSGSSTVVDSSGTGNTATTNSGVRWAGSAATFNGTTGAITTAGPALTTTASYSISAWANLTTLPTVFQTAVAQEAGVNAAFYLQFSATDNTWAFGQAATDAVNSAEIRAHATTVPTTATWYHLVGTYDSSTGAMTLYVNGAVAGTATNAAPIAASGPVTIGRAKYNGVATDFFNGQIANVQVYQRVLAPTEVSTLFGSGRTGGTVASSRQVTTSWRLDQRGLPLSMKDANGNMTNYGYDEAGHLAVVTSPSVASESAGSTPVSVRPVTMHGYNTFGDEVEVQSPNGSTVVNVYDENARPVSTRLPSYTPPGSTTAIVPITVRTYNAVGQLTNVSDPLVHDTHYVYDQLGDVAQATDANGGLTHYTYDVNGELLSVTDPTGARTQSTYDHIGRKITGSVLERLPSSAVYTTNLSYASSAANPGGAWLASQTSPAGVVSSFAYDRLGEQIATTDGAGNTTQYRYDHLGRRTASILPDATSTKMTYDELGNAIGTSTLDSTGAAVASRSATYDPVGNLLSSTDARLTTTRYTYDALSRLTQEVQPNTASTSITTTFGYDGTGNQTRFTDGRNNAWVYGYNTWNLMESEVEPPTATYSAAADRTFTTAYDATGHALRRSLPGGVAITATYDAMGQLKTQSGTGAEAVTADRSLDYDAAGRVTSARAAAAGSAPASALTFTYNDRGLPLTATGAAGNSSFTYTPDGLMGSRTDLAGTTGYTYDTAGRLATLTDPASTKTLTYGYNALSQVATVNYTSDTRAFGYDTMHRLATDTLKTSAGATVASIAYGYDANGNLSSKATTGFAGSATNSYGYDLADRLTSWTAGTTTVNYGYDASGNRTQVGANTYTYDARDQLTGDGTGTYQYSARGTLTSQTGGSGLVSSTSDAYGQTISHSTQTYAYDAVGRLLTVTPSTGTATQVKYTGTGNTPVADGTSTYTYSPAGSLVGIGAAAAGGGGVLAYTDQHRDVVGDFSATSTSLAGSTTYDPLGAVLATSSQAGRLGYQSGWTDPATQRVNMAARWYSPQSGQFTSRDTVEQAAVPNSVSFNPFAYGGANPMTGVDLDGHGFWSTVSSWGSNAWHATVTAWHATTNFVSTYIYHPIANAVSSAWNWTVHAYQTTLNRIRDEWDRRLKALEKQMAEWRAQLNAQVRAWNNEVKRRAAQAAHAVSTAYHATVKATTKAVTTAATFVKHHAAAIGSFVVSTAVFMGCEAALGALTAGVGAVAGAVACGALAGAAGGLFEQGAKCFDGQKGACSAGSFLKAGIIGGAIGGVSGFAGAMGGKALAAIGGKAFRAIGGLFGRGGTEIGEGAVDGIAVDAAASTVDTAAEGAASGAARSGARAGAKDAAGSGTPRGGEVPRGRAPSDSGGTTPPRAGSTPSGDSDPLVDVFRFADRNNPADLRPNVSRSPASVQRDVANDMKDPVKRAERAEAHMGGDTVDSPFLSVASSPFRAAATPDDWLYNITRGTPDLGFFQVPLSKLVQPANELSIEETELLVEGSLENYLVGWIPNPWKGLP